MIKDILMGIMVVLGFGVIGILGMGVFSNVIESRQNVKKSLTRAKKFL
jgi:hypothetical protein